VAWEDRKGLRPLVQRTKTLVARRGKCRHRPREGPKRWAAYDCVGGTICRGDSAFSAKNRTNRPPPPPRVDYSWWGCRSGKRHSSGGRDSRFELWTQTASRAFLGREGKGQASQIRGLPRDSTKAGSVVGIWGISGGGDRRPMGACFQTIFAAPAPDLASLYAPQAGEADPWFKPETGLARRQGCVVGVA